MTEKYGFVYIWRDKKHNRYYVGCHWGTVDDGYVCSSTWMRQAHKLRPEDFHRRILKTNLSRPGMYVEEQRMFDMIKPHEIKIRYYNLNIKSNRLWHADPDKLLSVGEKISKSKKGKKVAPCTPERAKKISEGKKGKSLVITEEGRAKRQESLKNRVVSDETKAATSASLKAYYEEHESKNKGKSLSDEHKAAISQKLMGIDRGEYVMTEARETALKNRSAAGATALSGSKAYNNGEIEVRSKTHPGEGWVLGGLKRRQYRN